VEILTKYSACHRPAWRKSDVSDLRFDDAQLGNTRVARRPSNLGSSNSWVEVVPIRIDGFDQTDLPGAGPFFQPLLALDRKFDIAELLIINHPAYTIFFRKTWNRLRSMFVDAPN